MDTIYFCDSSERIKIGFSSEPKNRLASHFLDGLTLRAIIPGAYQHEQSLHKFFGAHKLSYGKENFEPVDEIYKYIDRLLDEGYATNVLEEVETLPCLPYSVWSPNTIAPKSYNDGQLDIWGALPPKERVQFHSDIAYTSSITDEWFTPEEIIIMARKVMGKIDLDPSTTPQVNRKWIKAPIFYTRDLNGLSPDIPWNGSVWLNPPYGRGENSAAAFVNRLVKEFKSGCVQQAITCLNINSSTALWFNKVWDAANCHCIYRGRINFVSPDGDCTSSPSKGTILSYFGDRGDEFVNVFKVKGVIIHRVRHA